MNAVEDSIASDIYYHLLYQTFLKHMFYIGILPVAFYTLVYSVIIVLRIGGNYE